MCAEPTSITPPTSSKGAPTTILPDPTATDHPKLSPAAGVGCVIDFIRVPLRS